MYSPRDDKRSPESNPTAQKVANTHNLIRTRAIEYADTAKQKIWASHPPNRRKTAIFMRQNANVAIIA